MKSRFLFPNRFKVFGILFSVPFLVLGLYCLFVDFEFEWLSFNLPFQYSVFKDLGIDSKSINFTNEIAIIGFIISLVLIAFSKLKLEDEYIAKIRLESLQVAIYVNFALLILATIFIHGLNYFTVTVFNMFTPLIIFIFRFHYIIFVNKSKES